MPILSIDALASTSAQVTPGSAQAAVIIQTLEQAFGVALAKGRLSSFHNATLEAIDLRVGIAG